MDSRNVRNVEIDPHSSEDAILLRYDLDENGKSTKKSKIIQLKNFSDQLNPSTLAKSIVDQCSLIPSDRLHDVEQVIFYLQRRVSNKHELFKANGTADAANNHAQVVKLEEYIEMLYEDNEKLKASSLILSLCMKPSNLQIITENDVLVGALTRVFREDSRKNFELATNLASIFFQFSLFTKFHSLLSHYKIGALTLQLVENELKRFELWQEQCNQSTSSEHRRKWELAIRKQEVFVVECFKILANLAIETKIEIKMIKRGLLTSLAKCLDHTKSPLLLKTSILFLWKLSVYSENKDAMDKLRVVERVVEILGSADVELSNISFSLLFNLAFDVGMRGKMVSAGLTNHVSAHISTSEIALGLLYQTSILDDAKAMLAFTDILPTLMQLLKTRQDSLTVKGILMNVALEKRNAQLICGPDGKGLDFIMEAAFNKKDSMLMKVARNIATHEGGIQQHFSKWIGKLFDLVNTSTKQVPISVFSTECLAILASLSSIQWEHNAIYNEIIAFLRRILHDFNEKPTSHFSDEFLIQIVALSGVFAGQPNCISQQMLSICNDLIKLLNHKQEDDEFVLQISFCFARLIANPDLIQKICKEHEQVLEYLINMTHDKNQQLCAICDQALQLVSEIDEHWFKRIAEERFCWHNAQWLEIVEGHGANENVLSEEEGVEDEESFLSEQFKNAVFGVDDILGNTDLSE